MALGRAFRGRGFCIPNLSGMTRNYQGYAERHREKKLNAEEGGKYMKREDIATLFEDATDEQLDLCQYFGQKKLKYYADFFSSSSSLCCGVI